MQRRSRNDEEYIRYIEYVMYNEAELREAVEEARLKVVRPEIKTVSGQSDPTATEAIKNLTQIKSVVIGGRKILHPEQWLEVIGKVKNWCSRKGEKYLDVLNSRYGRKHYLKTCTDLNITSENFYRTLEKIRNYAAIQAAYYRLIRVD